MMRARPSLVQMSTRMRSRIKITTTAAIMAAQLGPKTYSKGCSTAGPAEAETKIMSGVHKRQAMNVQIMNFTGFLPTMPELT